MTDHDESIPGVGQAEPPSAATLLAEPAVCPTGHGGEWIKQGFNLFRRSPWVWIGMMVVLFLVAMLVGLVPVGSVLLSLLSPVITGGVMIGCKTLDEGGELEIAHLFAGFKWRTGALIKAGLLYMGLVLALAFVIGILGALIGISLPAGGAEIQAVPELSGSLALLVLLVAAFSIPVVMAYYFAPVLLVFHENLGVVEAFKLSFHGCLKNVMPFLVYGLLVVVLAILAAIPLGLGMLVLAPTIAGSMYAAYKDIFLNPDS